MDKEHKAAYQREWRRRNPEKVHESHKKYINKHPELKARLYDYFKLYRQKEICDILRHHAVEHKDDAERLQTSFILEQLVEHRKTKVLPGTGVYEPNH